MNNIILTLIITFTKFISLLPRSLFKRNSLMWKVLGNLMKRRRRIVEANINHCFKDKSADFFIISFIIFIILIKYNRSYVIKRIKAC